MKCFIACLLFWSFINHCEGQYLDQFLWKNRVIIIYENSSDLSKKGNTQLRTLLQETAALEERKLRILRYHPHTIMSIYPTAKKEIIEDIGISFQGEYEFILIGLDGSIKARSKFINSTERIFSIIDSMPMRQRELQIKKN